MLEPNLRSVTSPRRSVPAEGSKKAAKQGKGLGPYGNLHHRVGIQITAKRVDALNLQLGRLVTHLCQGHSGNPVSGCKGDRSRLAVSFSVKSVQSNSFWLKNIS